MLCMQNTILVVNCMFQCLQAGQIIMILYERRSRIFCAQASARITSPTSSTLATMGVPVATAHSCLWDSYSTASQRSERCSLLPAIGINGYLDYDIVTVVLTPIGSRSSFDDY